MNWYDGDTIYSMDKAAIVDPEHNTGWVNYVYAHCIWTNLNAVQKRWCKRSYVRILKYLLRGYRLSCVDPKTGRVHEFVTSQFPTEIRELSPSKREQYYRKHPNERPANIPEMEENHDL